jgi:hypothetical protein
MPESMPGQRLEAYTALKIGDVTWLMRVHCGGNLVGVRLNDKSVNETANELISILLTSLLSLDVTCN